MSIQQAYNDIRQTLQKEGVSWMPELKTENLALTSEQLDNQQAWLLIKAFQPTQGWVQTLDAVHLIENGQLPQSDNKQSNHLISAELVNAANESLHIRPANKGQLSAVRFTPGQGDSYYVTQTRHQIKHTTKKEEKKITLNGQATYQLYWPANQTQPAFSRLIEITL